MRMTKVRAIHVAMMAVALITSFLVGILSYRSHVTEYLEQDLLDKHTRKDQLTFCQIGLRESEETASLYRRERNDLWTCVREYSSLFDATKFDQKYSLDEVQRIEECW